MKNTKIWKIGMCWLSGGLLWLSSAGYAQQEGPLISELLEEGVYQEEAKGDLGAAIELYRQVVDSERASRSKAAEAQFRMAVCYHKQGNTTQAVEGFEALVDNYPSQEEWVEAALAYLPKPFNPETVPWVDGEITEMEIRLPNGFVVGYLLYKAEQIESENRVLWRLSNRMLANGENINMVEIDPDTMKPVFGYMFATAMDNKEISFWFEDEQVRVDYGEAGEKTVSIPAGVIDNTQAQFLMRQFPVETGFSTESTIFVGLTGTTLPVVFSVLGIEDVEVPAGLFECYHVEIKLAGQSQHFWFKTDESRKAVMFKAGGIEARATDYRVAGAAETRIFRDDRLGYEVAIPSAWGAFDTSDPDKRPDRSRLELRDSWAAMTCSITAQTEAADENEAEPGDLDRAADLARKQVDAYGERTELFELDEASWAEVENEDGATVSFSGFTSLNKQDLVMKKTVRQSGDTSLVFTLRCDPDLLATYEPIFDQMAASARID